MGHERVVEATIQDHVLEVKRHTCKELWKLMVCGCVCVCVCVFVCVWVCLHVAARV